MRYLIITAILTFAFGSALAQPIAFDFGTFQPGTGTPMPILRNGTPVPVGNFIQIIKPGANMQLDPPDQTPSLRGGVQGDDILNTNTYVGDGTSPDAGLFAVTLTAFFSNPPDLSRLVVGEPFYIRVWVGEPTTTIVSSVPVPEACYYADGGPFTVPATMFSFVCASLNGSNTAPLWTAITLSGVRTGDNGIIHSFSLAVCPNPFNVETIVTFSVPQTAPTEISVYNLLGEKVATLVNDARLSAGIHRVRWNGSDYSAGEYYLRLVSGRREATEKILLVK